MERSKKQIYLLLCIVLVLVGILLLFYLNPSILQNLPWLSSDEGEPPSVEQPSGDENAGNENGGEDQTDQNQSGQDHPDQNQPDQDQPGQDQPGQELPPEDTPSNPDSPGEDVEDPRSAIVELTGQYYTYTEMKQDMVHLYARYPDLMSYGSYGVSADGRDLLCVTLGNPNAPAQVLITSGMHAREYVNAFVVMRQLEYYLQNYETATYLGHPMRELFDEVCFVIVPMTNPDGITLAQEGLSSLRSEPLRQMVRNICRSLGITDDAAIDKYLNNYWKSNANGVDLNRNFDALWAEHYDGIGQPAVKNYKGESPLSEYEAAYLTTLTESLSNPVASVCVHSQGQIIYWRCFQEGALEIQNRRLAELASSITGYSIIDENQAEPSFSNWTILEHGIPTITVETGIQGYPQNHATMWEAIFDDIRDLWAALALEYGDFAKG